LQPLFQKSFTFDMKAAREGRLRVSSLEREIEALDERRKESRTADQTSKNVSNSVEAEITRRRNELATVLQRPYRAAGFPELGAVSRWMVRTRYTLFGKWSLGPVAGRDEFGRDVLSRVFWGARISIIVGI